MWELILGGKHGTASGKRWYFLYPTKTAAAYRYANYVNSAACGDGDVQCIIGAPVSEEHNLPCPTLMTLKLNLVLRLTWKISPLDSLGDSLVTGRLDWKSSTLPLFHPSLLAPM